MIWLNGFMGFGTKKVGWMFGGVDTPLTAMTTRATAVLKIKVQRVTFA